MEPGEGFALGDRVPDVVHGDHADLVLVADAPEGPDEVPRFDRPASAACEDQVRAGPGRAHVEAVVALLGELRLECLVGEVQKRQVALSGVGSDRAEVQFAAYALKLLADVDDPCVKVDITPAQAEDFAAAQPLQD